MGGTSGALYSIFFAGLGKALRDQAGKGAKSTTPEVWATATAEALTILYKCELTNSSCYGRLMNRHTSSSSFANAC